MTLTNMTSAQSTTDKRDEARDKIAVLRRQEATTYRRPLPTTNTNDHTYWRQSIVEWMYNVVDTCGLQRDAVAVASYYLDATPTQSREDYQLCAMTSLQLALKLYDSTSLKWSSLVRLGRGAFSEDDIAQMEQHILHSLQWRVHPPTALCFLREYLQLLPADMHSNAHYRIVQVSRFVFEFVNCLGHQYLPSQLAYAGMCVAMQRMDAGLVAEIHECMTGLAELSELELVYQNLQASLEHNVSLHELLVQIDAHCDPVVCGSESPLPSKQIIQLGSSPRQVSG